MNKELFQIYLNLVLNANQNFDFYWEILRNFTGAGVDYKCEEYIEACKIREKVKSSPLYRELE